MPRKTLFEIILIVFLLGLPAMASFIQLARASSKVYIRANGSVDPLNSAYFYT